MGRKIFSVAITAAIFQGNGLDDKAFLKPLPDVCSVRSLKRCLYGLNNAPSSWYERIRTEFRRLGAVVSTYDEALFLCMTMKESSLEFLLVMFMILHLL